MIIIIIIIIICIIIIVIISVITVIIIITSCTWLSVQAGPVSGGPPWEKGPLHVSGKDKGGPSKGGFLNNMLFPRIMHYLYTHAISFITQI